ncbi:MAG: DUF5053 domain-containing protein, partial [Edaphocola sp.]
HVDMCSVSVKLYHFNNPEKIKELRNRYSSTEDEAVRVGIIREMDVLRQSDPDAYEDALIECIKDSTREAKELRVRRQIENILPAISVSYIAKTYFKKNKEWFYQRLNGNVVNG